MTCRYTSATDSFSFSCTYTCLLFSNRIVSNELVLTAVTVSKDGMTYHKTNFASEHVSWLSTIETFYVA